MRDVRSCWPNLRGRRVSLLHNLLRRVICCVLHLELKLSCEYVSCKVYRKFGGKSWKFRLGRRAFMSRGVGLRLLGRWPPHHRAAKRTYKLELSDEKGYFSNWRIGMFSDKREPNFIDCGNSKRTNHTNKLIIPLYGPRQYQ